MEMVREARHLGTPPPETSPLQTPDPEHPPPETPPHAGSPERGKLQITYEGQGQVTLSGDGNRLKQLALILLDNAVRYTPSGGWVWVTLEEKSGRALLSSACATLGLASRRST